MEFWTNKPLLALIILKIHEQKRWSGSTTVLFFFKRYTRTPILPPKPITPPFQLYFSPYVSITIYRERVQNKVGYLGFFIKPFCMKTPPKNNRFITVTDTFLRSNTPSFIITKAFCVMYTGTYRAFDFIYTTSPVYFMVLGRV